MSFVLSKKESKHIDFEAIKTKYITKSKLMDNAGRLSAQFFVEKTTNPFNQKVLVLAGKGDNGGDAIIMHHYLRQYGVDSKLYLFDFNYSKHLVNRYKISHKHIIKSELKKIINSFDWFIDGIFGIGLNRKIKNPYNDIIKLMDSKNIISLDIPSGIECDTGLPISEFYIEPKYVLCMGYYKNANVFNTGKISFKNTYVLDIGLPEIVRENVFLADIDFIKSLVKKDDLLRSKYSYSCSAIVGSDEYRGAGVLSVSSAISSGVGYIKSIIPSNLLDIFSLILESINCPVGKGGYFSLSDYSSIINSDILYKESPILIGPGLGNKKTTIKLVSKLLKYFKKNNANCILDASGFEPLYNGFEINDLPDKCILTPHLGEFKKIFINIDTQNPIKACKKVYKKMGGRVMILKGSSTIVLTSKGKCVVFNNGNSTLASAGSGDVLSGIILALMSKGYDLDSSAILGVYIHGECSKSYSADKSNLSMPSHKIINIIPRVLNEIFS